MFIGFFYSRGFYFKGVRESLFSSSNLVNIWDEITGCQINYKYFSFLILGIEKREFFSDAQ
jgi:hypothetical protein